MTPKRVNLAQVTVDVYGRLHKRSFDRTVTDIQRDMERAGQNAGNAFGDQFARGMKRSTGRAQAAMIGVTSAAEKLRTEQAKLRDVMRSNDFDKISAQADKVTKAYKSQDSAVRNLQTSYAQFDKATDVASNATSSLTQNITQLGGAVGALGKIGGPAAIVGIGGALVEVAGVAASAAQSLWLLPAAAAAAGAGIGTLKLATTGFSEAIESIRDPEAFAEALQALSPSAQQAALSIKGILPAIDELKRATQDALFAGVGQQLTTLANQYLPTIQSMTTGIASSFGGMFRGVTDQLMTPETFGAVSETVNNIVAAFHNLAPAAAPLTQALAEITRVGSGFLPEIAAAASQAAQAFSEFITQASQSGDLQRWLSEGLDTLGLLGEAAWQLAQAFMQLAPVGQAVLPDIVRLLENINTLIPFIQGSAMLVGPAIGTWVVATESASRSIDAMKTVFEGLANFAIGHINRIGEALNALTGPLRSVAGLAGISIPSFTPVNPMNLTGPGGGGAYLPKGGGGSLPPAFGLPSTAPTGPFSSLSPADRWLRADAAANPSGGVAGAPGTYRRRDGSIGFTATPSMTGDRPAPLAGPYAASGGGGGSAATDLPVLPSGNRDPMSLLQGYPVNSSLYGAAGGVLDAQQRRAQAEADLNTLLKSNTATANEIQDKRNELAKAEREQHEAELRLQEAKADSTEKFTNQVQDLNSGVSELSAGLDQDLGLSRGLAGLADNLVRFLAAIATAPLQARLQQQINANPNEGSGIVGILAAQGAFGEQFTPSAIGASSQGTYGTAGYASPIGYGNSYGGYPGDAALLSRVPAGSYDASGDLSQGLGDCSSAVEDLVNILDGRPTGGRSLATGNAHEWLQSRGFVPGYMPGAFNVGFDSGHMEATLPGGTNFNWGSDAAAARGGIGGQGASSFPNTYYRPVGASPDLYSAANTIPALNNPSWASGPAALPNVMGGGGESPVLGNGPIGPGIGSSVGYQPTVQPQAPQAWQPGSKGGGGGGVAGAALGAAAGMFPGGGAAAQIAMQMIQRTIAYGGEVAGSLAQGALDFFSVSDPDGGPGASLGDSWLGRLAGSFASAAPSLPSTAGGADKASEAGKQQVDPNTQQHGQGGGKPPGAPLIGNMYVQQDKMEAQKMAQTLQYASAASGVQYG